MRKFYFYTYVKIEKRGDYVKKRISAAFLAVLLVLQVLSSGYLAPMAAFANEPVSTNETTNTQAPEQTAEQQAEAEAAQKKALEEAQQAVDDLFTDATKTEITSYVTIYTFNRDFLKDVEEGKEREALQHDLDLAQTFVTVNALFKEDRKTIVDGLQKTTVDAATAQIQNLQGASAESKNALEEKIKLASEQLEKSATQAEKEEVTKTEPKEETTKTESKEEKVTSKKKATLQTKEAASEPEIKKISLWTAKPEANDKAEGGHDLFTPKGDNLSTTAVNTGAGFFALYDWVLPKGTYEEGKTYELEFETPSQFKAITTGTQVLTTVEGDKIGTYKVSGRTVTLSFTFTDTQKGLLNALEDEDLLGQFWVGHGFTLSAEDLEKDEVTVDYKKGSEIIASIIVKQKQEPLAPKIVKSGEKVIDTNGNVQIKWTVDVNNTKEANKTVVLTDTLPEGLTITKATMQQYETTSKGVFTTPVAGTEKNITVSGNTLPLGEISAPYRVTYYTDIPDAQQEGTKTFTNSVKATGLSQDLTDQATVTIDFGKPLVKEGVGYNTAKQLATWRITYNGNHKDVESGTVQDTFKSGEGFAEHEFVGITKVIKVDKNGTETDVLPSKSGIIADSKGSTGVTFNMPAGTNQYIFEYTTKPVQRLSSNDKLGNSASFDRGNNNVVNTGDIEIKGQQGVGVKSGKVDFAQKTVKWTITLNSDLNGIQAGTVIQDIFGINEALVMTDAQFTSLQSAYKAATRDDGAKFSRKSPENKGFEITLGKDIKEKVSFTYETNFDTSKLTVDNKSLVNAIIVGKQDTTATDTKDSITITPKDLTLNNGEKRGVYNPQTKEITWTAIINYNLRTLNNLTITDDWSNNQTYVDGSMKISELELGAAQNSFTEGTATEHTPKNITATGLTFDLPKNNKAYKVTYKTKVGDKVTGEVYTNTISYTDDVKTYELKDSVKPNYATDPAPGSNADLIKTGKQDGEYAHWRVLINPAQNVYTSKYIFQDTIDVTKHRFVEGSVKISKVTASDTDGNYLDRATATTPIKNGENGIADFAITTNAGTSVSTMAFNFPTGLNQTYILEYDTLLLVDNGVSVSNKATFDQDGTGSSAGSDQSNVQVDWAAAGASAAIKGSGKLKVKKVSPTNQPIKGIQFIIYDLKGNELERITTNANGIAETQSTYKFKEYLVEEVASSLNYKPITGKNKYILTNITATIDAGYHATERPVTAVIANELNTVNATSCTKQEITITNGRKDEAIEKVVLYKSDGTKVQEFTGSSIGTEKSETFQIPTKLLGENYKVKVFYNGENAKEITKANFKWDYKTYKDGVGQDGCAGTYTVEGGNACTNVTVAILDTAGKPIQNARVKAVTGENSVEGKALTNSNGEVTFTSGSITPGTTKLVIEKSGYDWKQEVLIDANTKIYDCHLQMEIKVEAPATACASTTIKFNETLPVGTKITIIDKKDASVVESPELVTATDSYTTTKPLTSESAYKIKIEKPGQRTKEFDNIRIYDCTVPITLKLTACTNTTVTVKEGTTGLANARVEVVRAGAVIASGTTGSQGTVDLNKVVSKEDTIKVYKSGYLVKEVAVSDYVYNCALEITVADLKACDEVTVTITNGATKIADARVTIKDGNTVVATGTTDAEGKIVLSTEETEKFTKQVGYTVIIEQPGKQTITKTGQKFYGCELTINVGNTDNCGNTVVTVRSENQNLANARVEVLDSKGDVIATKTTNTNGQATFDVAIPKDTTLKVYKPGYKVQTISTEKHIYNCAIQVDIPSPTACDDTTFTFKEVIKSGAIISVKNNKDEEVVKHTLTTEEAAAKSFKTNQLLTSPDAYTVIIEQTGEQTITIQNVFAYDCTVAIDQSLTNACADINLTFKNEKDEPYAGNKIRVVDAEGVVQYETTLSTEGTATIDVQYAQGNHQVILVQDGKKSISTKIDTIKCEQTIIINSDITPGTPGGACENTTITVKDGTKLVENARVVITDQDGAELFNGVTDSKGQITTKEYIALKDVTVKVYAKGYNTATTFTLSDEDCKAEVNLTPNACPDYAINVVDEKGDKIAAEGFLNGSVFTIKNQNGDIVATDVKINKNGQLVDSKDKIINKDELKNYTTDTYTLVQTKTAPGYQTMQDAVVQDLDNCSGLVTINFNKTTEPTNPGVSCPDFKVTYKGPANSTAEFKIVKVTTDADGKVTKEDIETGIKVVTDTDTKVSTLNTTTKSFEPGKYELVQTKGTSGYYNSNDIPFEVKMGECVAELTVTNTVVPPPACTNDVVVTVKDTEGKAVSTENAKVTVDGKETSVTGSNSQVTIPKTALDSSKEQTVIITLEDGRTTTVVLPANRVDCTANAVVPVLKVCEQDKTITIKDANGKDVPADKIVKVTVGDKEVTPKVENGKLVISKDLINPKEDTTITVTTKGGEQGFVTIPKYSETCDYTIVIQNACDAFTVNVTENGKKATTGTVSIVDADGKTVATEKVSANGTAKFPAKYADAAYTVNVTIGKTTVTTPVNVNENCAVTVNVKTLACDEAAVVVTLDGKAQKGVKVSVVDSKGKVVQTVTTDAKGNAKIDPKYATKEYQVKVTVGKETKTVTMTSCNVTIDFKAPVTDGETEEPTEPGKPNKPTTPEKPSKPGVVTGGDTEENTNSSKPSKPGVKPGDHYDVYDKDGNLVASDVTVDKDGNISADLPPGEYDFVSKGEHVTAEVGKDGKLPQTGSSDFLLYTLAGIALLGASLVVFARGRKKSA